MTQYAEPPAPQWPAPPPAEYPPPAYPPPPMPDGSGAKPGDPDYQWSIPTGPPGWSPEPAPRPKRARAILGIGGGILTLVLIRVAIGSGFDFAVGATRDPLYTPQQVGSATRMTSGEARDAENAMKSGLAGSLKAQAGIYGRNGRPQYALVAGYSDDDTAKRILDSFGAGTEDAMGPLKTMQDGIVCATFAPEGVKGAVCAWATGDDSDGLLWAYAKPDVNALAKLTAKARTDVETKRAL